MSMFSHFDSQFGDDAIDLAQGAHTFEAGHGSHIGDVSANFEGGHLVVKSANFEHGHDTFTDGVHTTHTQANALGGQNIYHGHELTEVTVPNVHGGIDVYDGSMHHEGSFLPDVHGGEDYLNFSGNGEAIMSYHDPLAHSSEYQMDPFDISHHSHLMK